VPQRNLKDAKRDNADEWNHDEDDDDDNEYSNNCSLVTSIAVGPGGLCDPDCSVLGHTSGF
jgi:hypothetical protein